MMRASSPEVPAAGAGSVPAAGAGSVPAAGPVPLLLLAPATGGGHRSAAAAVAEAVRQGYPGRFIPVVCDPLAGPGAARPLRWIARGYGPLIRYAPWLWGLLYRATDSRPAARLLHLAVAALAGRLVTEAVAGWDPAAIVSFHPLTGHAAVRARDAAAPGAPVVTVVTDLGPPHATWTWPRADRTVPAAAAGVPVGPRSAAAPPGPAERAALRGRLGHPGARFLVVAAGGAEGAGRLARRAAAIARRLPDVEVAVICGRNRRLRRRLDKLAARRGGRLSVHGFVTDMAAWLRAADVVVTKAGPGTIAEAACCGAAMLLTCRLPGQERGNPGQVTAAGAGMYLPRTGRLVAGVARLRDDAAALAAMRAASARLARPDAAAGIAAVVAGLAGARCAGKPRRARRPRALPGGQHG
jgi:1,2-diacylglycerol 3-beta-galactosyltransferase